MDSFGAGRQTTGIRRCWTALMSQGSNSVKNSPFGADGIYAVGVIRGGKRPGMRGFCAFPVPQKPQILTDVLGPFSNMVNLATERFPRARRQWCDRDGHAPKHSLGNQANNRPRNNLSCHAIEPVLQGIIMARSSTSFRPKWKLGNTTVIRVPKTLAPTVLQFAHDLDDKSDPLELREPTSARDRAAKHAKPERLGDGRLSKGIKT